MPDDRPAATEPRLGSTLRGVLLIAVVLGMVWLVLNVQLPSLRELREGVDDLRASVTRLGWWALPAFAVAYAAVAVTPIPVTIMAVTAGILFGTVAGSVVSVLGVLVGCWGAYWLARALGQATVSRLLGRRSAGIEERLRDQGFEAVFLLRVMPGLPYWPVNYGSGAFGVSQRDFVLATGLAAIPGQISLVAIGTFLIVPSVWRGVVVAVSWVAVLGLTWWGYRRLRGAPDADETA